MTTVIIYKSNHGSTKQYAKWLQESIPESEIFEMDTFPLESIDKYETIIIGSYEKCGEVPAFDFAKANWGKIRDKKNYIFRVGLLKEDTKFSLDTFNTLPEEIRNNALFGKLPGQLNNFFEKFGFKMFAKGDPTVDINPDSKIDKAAIKPIVEFARNK